MTSQRLGKYEIISTIGRGSMGLVFKAQDPEIGRLVAVKTLRNVSSGMASRQNELLERFRIEARSAGKLRHPNIVTVFESGRAEDGTPYIVMDYIEGESLDTIIQSRGPLSLPEALHYLAQIASAIDYAHSQKVFHRDIKPSNVIIDKSYSPQLLDFGVAKVSDTSLTPAGTVVGTPSYMSPEQIRGVDEGGGTDLFALAVMAFEMITGSRPFPGKDFVTVVASIMHRDPVPFKEINPNLPIEIESIVGRALAKSREDRFPSGMTFVSKVAGALSVPIDSKGLVGGYRPGMTLEELTMASSRLGLGNVGADSDDIGVPGSLKASPVRSSSSTMKAKLDADGPFVEPAVHNGVNDTLSEKKDTLLPVSHNKAADIFSMIGIFILLLAVVAIGGYFIGTDRSEVLERDDGNTSVSSEMTSAVRVDSAARQVRDKPKKREKFREEVRDSSESEVAAITNTLSVNKDVSLKIEQSKTSEEGRGAILKTEAIPVPPKVLPLEIQVALQEVEEGSGLSTSRLDNMIGLVKTFKNKELLDALCQISLNSSFETKVKVLRVLEEESKEAPGLVISGLRALLDDKDRIVRGKAVKIIGSLRGAEALKLVEDRLQQEKDPLVSQLIKEAIKSIETNTSNI